MTTKDIITLCIAGYASLVSTAVLIWNIVNTRKDKGKILFTGYKGKLLDHLSEKDIIKFEFVNSGKRAIVLRDFGGEYKMGHFYKGNSHFLINPASQLPKKLEPGESLQEVLPNLKIAGPNVKRLFATDTLGNKYKMRRKDFKKMVKDTKSYLAP
ncbi:hypothetical protein [Paenibacillus pseudetheri]|uniref:Uncharacterized protein n=1 Tax=Paenibacillus pseudetheri TaxID=2897682 RepID=A0ABN8FVX4_9BACL|nr:hypothetical protein [Paenibacillus pseudetheri]CAH1059824.1 hypothetical protein PAECIP111894_06036 [Paenibacillus pseudetheri]